jgi:hypothetical protein
VGSALDKLFHLIGMDTVADSVGLAEKTDAIVFYEKGKGKHFI